MQTALAEFIKDTPVGREADSILRKCVHCGFCTATCPTYQLLGDELDGPRGRIYLMKQMLEGHTVSSATQLHLDRCLSCRSCETTCPSGVEYGRLLDLSREMMESRVPRPASNKLMRTALRWIIPYRGRFGTLLRLGQWVKPLLPQGLKRSIPARQVAGPVAETQHERRVLLLDGCVQPSIAPNINAATTRVLDKLGISGLTAPDAGCCGAVSHHLSAPEQARGFMRRNINAWWPYVEQGVEAIVMTASGCGSVVKDYGYLLRDDARCADKARRIAEMTCDLSEIVAREDCSKLVQSRRPFNKVAFQSPCTLQHGQKIAGVVEKILTETGYELTPVVDPHLCCGSAGTYSILQPELSQQLLGNKLTSLQSGSPEAVVTANIGCLSHLATEARVPVRHWVELLAD
ncbi:MAG: glycolate oxidase subunit GlcF [Gammaproteobacteria bacterium]|nr:glycolate oxidase subunit GlcF [Gammaproteobacteria bacterium]